MEQIKFIEHDKQKLRRDGRLPRCYFCGGDMLPIKRRLKDTWQCEDCGSILRQGIPLEIANNIINTELNAIEKSKRQHHGRNTSGRKRKKSMQKHKIHFYPNSDAG